MNAWVNAALEANLSSIMQRIAYYLNIQWLQITPKDRAVFAIRGSIFNTI
jgi:hypothetical protein